MTYHQKAMICTSGHDGQGKVVYLEDDNGKVKKKTKHFKSPEEIGKFYKKMGFDEPNKLVDVEEFMDFSITSPIALIQNLSDHFFHSRNVILDDEQKKDVLPEGVDIDKHRKRLLALKEKARIYEQEKIKKIENKKYLEGKLHELNNILKEFQAANDKEAIEDISKDIKKIEESLKKD